MTTTYSNIAASVVEQFRSKGWTESEIEERNDEAAERGSFISFLCSPTTEQVTS
jgi:hypothetical protein